MQDPAGRAALVSRRLDRRLRVDVGVPVADVPAEEWWRVETAPGECFGYLWPRHLGNEIVVAYSPEVIAGQTTWLTEGEFGRYVDLVELVLARAARELWAHPERTPDARRQIVEDAVFAERPEGRDWLAQVQLHVLDLAAAPAAPTPAAS